MKSYIRYSDWQENSGYIDPSSACKGADESKDPGKPAVGSSNNTSEASSGKRVKEKHATHIN